MWLVCVVVGAGAFLVLTEAMRQDKERLNEDNRQDEQ